MDLKLEPVHNRVHNLSVRRSWEATRVLGRGMGGGSGADHHDNDDSDSSVIQTGCSACQSMQPTNMQNQHGGHTFGQGSGAVHDENDTQCVRVCVRAA